MRHPFKPGDVRHFKKTVEPLDTARFDSGQVHAVYSTFALARDAEWCCRLFVLEMKDDHEEGIGTMLTVKHEAPALVGQEVTFTATVKAVERNEIVCRYDAHVNERLIATGEQGQKILPKEKLERLFASLI